MEGYDVSIRPGVILEDLGSGRIKAEVPGLFSEDDQDKLPTIYPAYSFFGSHTNQYSQPIVGDECVVMFVRNNPHELFWFRKDEYVENLNDIDIESNAEVIMCRRNDTASWASIFYTDGTGVIIRNGQPVIALNPDGEIVLDNGCDKRKITISGQSIALGSSGVASHPAALGDVVQEALEVVGSALQAIQQAASANVYTQAISAAMAGMPEQLNSLSSKCTSADVSLE